MTKYSFYFFIAIICFNGCDVNQETQSPPLTSDLFGSISLRDSSAFPVANDILVELEGTEYKTLTNSGNWTLKGVKSGEYTISFSKDGYSTLKYREIVINANGKPIDFIIQPDLYKIPFRFVRGINLETISSQTIKISGKISEPIDASYGSVEVATFVGLDSNHIYFGSNAFSSNTSYVSGTDTFTTEFYINALKSIGAKSGFPIYFISYVAADITVGYYDSTNTYYIRTGLCTTPSNIIKWMVP